MKLHTFIAGSAGQAVEQIRHQLGPQAVVLNVRKLPVGGLARFWQPPRIEVLAGLPEASEPAVAPNALSELRQELCEIKKSIEQRILPVQLNRAGLLPTPQVCDYPLVESAGESKERPSLEVALASAGLMPLHVHCVLEAVNEQLGGRSDVSPAQQLAAARQALVRLWPRREAPPSNFHVFVGPPGVGKTTVLNKWLAQTVLLQERPARVWRLDGAAANTAESLSIFAEILGVPVERAPEDAGPKPAEMTFIDLPGTNSTDPAAVKDLVRSLAAFHNPQIHLVLNASYESHVLQEQARAFRASAPADVILTHLDEETRWGKLWNFVLGTNYTVSFLSAGQNLPGDFHRPDPEALLARFFPLN